MLTACQVVGSRMNLSGQGLNLCWPGVLDEPEVALIREKQVQRGDAGVLGMTQPSMLRDDSGVTQLYSVENCNSDGTQGPSPVAPSAPASGPGTDILSPAELELVSKATTPRPKGERTRVDVGGGAENGPGGGKVQRDTPYGKLVDSLRELAMMHTDEMLTDTTFWSVRKQSAIAPVTSKSFLRDWLWLQRGGGESAIGYGTESSVGSWR